MNEILKSIFPDISSELIASVILGIFALSWSTIVYLISRRKKKKQKIIATELMNRFESFEIDSDERILQIENEIDLIRNKIVNAFKTAEIDFDGFTRLNKELNSIVSQFRLSYLKWLLKDYPNIKNTLEIISSDSIVTKADVLYLLREIKNSENIDPEQKRFYLSHISDSLIKKNKVLDVEDIFTYDPLIKERHSFLTIKRYVFLIVPIFLIVIAFILLTFKSKPDYVIGVIGFVSDNQFPEVSKSIEDYLKDQVDIDFKVVDYNYDDFKDLLTDISENKVQLLFLNPGSYLSVIDTIIEKDTHDWDIVWNNMDIFATHQVAGSKFLRSIIFARKDSLESFCRRKGYEIQSLLPDTLNRRDKKKELIYRGRVREFLTKHGSIIALVKRYSFSGLRYPLLYLQSPELFNIRLDNKVANKNDSLIEVSGDHDLTIEGVINGKYNAGATYNGHKMIMDNPELFSILFFSDKAPYNSYWIKNDIPPKSKEKIINAFLIAHSNQTNSACNMMEVLGNAIGMEKWVECNNKEYADYFEPIVEGMQIPQPRPLLILSSSGVDPNCKINCDNLKKEVLRIIASRLICDTTSSENFSLNETPGYYTKVFRVGLSWFSDLHHNRDLIIRLSDLSGSDTTIVEFDYTKLCENDTGKVIKERVVEKVLDGILKLVAFEGRIYSDKDGCFINYGYENGVLTNDNGLIDSRIFNLLSIDDSKVIPIMDFKKPEENLTPFKSDAITTKKWNNHRIRAVYNTHELIKNR